MFICNLQKCWNLGMISLLIMYLCLLCLHLDNRILPDTDQMDVWDLAWHKIDPLDMEYTQRRRSGTNCRHRNVEHMHEQTSEATRLKKKCV